MVVFLFYREAGRSKVDNDIVMDIASLHYRWGNRDNYVLIEGLSLEGFYCNAHMRLAVREGPFLEKERVRYDTLMFSCHSQTAIRRCW